MPRISSNYEAHTKDELLAEAEARGIEGLSSSSLKADIVSSLESDDESNEEKTEEDQPELTPATVSAPKVPGPVPSNIPTVAAKVNLPKVRVLGQPPEDSAYQGRFIETSSGEPYALAVLKESEVENKKTHFLKNSLHFHNLTEEEFRLKFTKE